MAVSVNCVRHGECHFGECVPCREQSPPRCGRCRKEITYELMNDDNAEPHRSFIGCGFRFRLKRDTEFCWDCILADPTTWNDYPRPLRLQPLPKEAA